jgi:site-specific recombinase XerD
MKKVAALAGIERHRLSSHVLRKTAGDRLLRQGFTVHQVAHALRIDAKTVLWTYSTLDEKAFEEKLKDFTLVKNVSGVAANDDAEVLEIKKDEGNH